MRGPTTNAFERCREAAFSVAVGAGLLASLSGCYLSHERGAGAPDAAPPTSCEPIPASVSVRATVTSAEPASCVRVGFSYDRTVTRPPTEASHDCTGDVTLTANGCAETLMYTCSGVEYIEQVSGTLDRGGSVVRVSTEIGFTGARCDRTERWVIQ